jgi:electron transfer flavoprotein beta subunit
MSYFLSQPVVTGIKALDFAAETSMLTARREYRGVSETFRLPLPAVVTVKEGINLPRYPSLPGRLRAKRAVIERIPVLSTIDQPQRLTSPEFRAKGLRVPAAAKRTADVLGSGVAAVPELVRVLGELGVLS